MKLILQTLLSAAFVVATMQPSAAVEPRITGVIRVIDGDTIALGKTRIRLFGIDAVEGDQPCTAADGTVLNCGAWVSSLVHQSYDGQRADCVRVDTDRYGRTVARCKAITSRPKRRPNGQGAGYTLMKRSAPKPIAKPLKQRQSPLRHRGRAVV